MQSTTEAPEILEGASEETLDRVIEKSIAVCSGKGGVGKTITACNLAIYYARKGLHVGLVDLDPLSDVASLLDLHESEDALRKSGPADRDIQAGLSSSLLEVFRGLEILFPFQKLGAGEVKELMEKIYREHLLEIDRRYDLLIFDMPAGMGYEDNLSYVPFMRRLVLVTNPEPTAHASAGAYVKEVQRLYPGKGILIWHNRYTGRLKEGFNPRDVAGNYNRFVGPSDRLTPEERERLTDFAFVPEDPSLDLLQGDPNPILHALESMKDALDNALGRLLSQASKKVGIPGRIQDIVTFYIQRNPRIGDPEEYLKGLGGYLNGLLNLVLRSGPDGVEREYAPQTEPFTPEEKAVLIAFLRRLEKSALRRDILRLADLLDGAIGRMEESRRAFSTGLPAVQDKALDRELGRFLVTLNASAGGNTLIKNHGALLLFYFSLHKLLQSKTLLRVLGGLIPRKTNRQGRKVRDRLRQIRILVEGDAEYRARYLKTMRTLYALVTRQLVAVAEAFELGRLLLKDRQSKIDGRAYLKLLGAFLHETLYSGLSVIVGFDYRSAAAAFQDGAERLLRADD